jgi:peptidoglycan/xylan/chitin deacetylase (PgdA/CDA1 family)
MNRACRTFRVAWSPAQASYCGRIISLRIDRGNGFLRFFLTFESNDSCRYQSEVQKHLFRFSTMFKRRPGELQPEGNNSVVQILTAELSKRCIVIRSNLNSILINLLGLGCLMWGLSTDVRAQEKDKAKPGAEALPGINWSVDHLQQAVAPVRPGRVLLPQKWPNNARIAVVLSFDIDNESYPLSTGVTSPGPLSDAEYGATEGLPRIIAMLDRMNVPATFFTPAVSAILAPEMVPQILKSGKNEIALHGWIHESVDILDDAVQEQRLLGQAVDYLTKVSGKKPLGSRTGSWAFSPYTLSADKKLGLTYDSSLMAMDVPYELVSNGKDTGIVELPVTWVADDGIFFGAVGDLPSPKLVFQVFQEEFDMAYRERSFVMLTFHPNAERRSRFLYLERLVAYMKTKPDVWFATAAEVVNWIKLNPTVDTPFSRMPEQH